MGHLLYTKRPFRIWSGTGHSVVLMWRSPTGDTFSVISEAPERLKVYRALAPQDNWSCGGINGVPIEYQRRTLRERAAERFEYAE